jgi:hypothetical protein
MNQTIAQNLRHNRLILIRQLIDAALADPGPSEHCRLRKSNRCESLHPCGNCKGGRMTYDDWKTTEPENDSADFHPRNCGCRRCEPDIDLLPNSRDRDEWRHEAAEQQRLK